MRRGECLRFLRRAALCVVLAPTMAGAQSRIGFQAFGGGAGNADTSLTLRQAGQPEIVFSARWETRPFEEPLYWALRLSLERRSGTWELQLIHHKLYLANLPSGVERMEVTHGFNLLTVGRAFFLGHGFDARCAAGVVLAHAESVVRGDFEGNAGSLAGGYDLTGPALLAGAGWRLPLSRRFFVSLEAAVSAAHARVPIARGDATFWNFAAHGLFGIGVSFGGPPGP